MAKNLDLAVVSIGDINPQSTSLAAGMIEASELRELLALGERYESFDRENRR